MWRLFHTPIEPFAKHVRSAAISVKRQAYKFIGKQYRRNIVLFASTVTVMSVVGTSYLAFHEPSKPKTASAVVVTKPAQKPAPTCANDASLIFASCPSVEVDFSKLANGGLSDQYFSVYTGQPEANQEAQYYTGSTDNIRISDGTLQLRALSQYAQGKRYTSARISTRGKQSFQYGKLVVRATLPSGIGTWPAIWMLPSNPKYASLSPDTDFSRYLNDGEIDIAESAGVEPHRIYGIAHSRAYPADGANRNYYSTRTVADSDTTFHDYEVDWTPTNLTFRIDGKAFFTVNKQPGADYRSWPYDQQFYLIINLAIGGTWAGSNRADFPLDGVDPNALPATLAVQSIRYYPFVGH